MEITEIRIRRVDNGIPKAFDAFVIHTLKVILAAHEGGGGAPGAGDSTERVR